ncbi:MAG: carboxypeptidase regulatory-like domain-containing protein [Gemmatimonadetes bacterium]|nr:carboxypeptidase regulatory-like domain-containing protein [Gemmatimonadota bacterium]
MTLVAGAVRISVARLARRRAGRVTIAPTALLGWLAASITACASQGTPPGGPPDRDPPAIVAITPDTQAVGVRATSVVFRFDEVVNERSTPGTGGSSTSGGMGGASGGFGGASMGGEASLAVMFAISPSDGRERVRWRREAIEIEPRGGFRPNTTYRIALLPGLSDLRGNARKDGAALVFSTGPALATSAIDGVVFDWVGGKPAAAARLEAFVPGDTTFRWRARTDSSGRFVLPSLSPGRYLLRGWIDQNQNGSIDGREAFDSVTVTLGDAATRALYAFEHDTTGPRLESVELVDSTGLRLKFDRAPSPDWAPVATTVTLQRVDSSRVPIGLAMPAARFDSLRAARAAAADTLEADTTAVDSVAPAPRPAPTLDRPVPILGWVVPLEQPLPPGTYRLKVQQVRGLTGRVRDSEREIRVRPPAPKDSTAARPRRP